MSLSQPALQAILAQQTDKCFLECITITHPSMTTQRFVSDNQDLTRSAGTYNKANFQIHGMSQDETQLPQLRLVADNVDQRIITEIRTLAGTRDDITVTYDVVLSDTPDVIEYGPIDFRIDSVSNNLKTLTVVMSWRSGYLNNAFPFRQFAPSNAG